MKTSTGRAQPAAERPESPANGCGNTVAFPLWKQTFKEIVHQIRALTNAAKKGQGEIFHSRNVIPGLYVPNSHQTPVQLQEAPWASSASTVTLASSPLHGSR